LEERTFCRKSGCDFAIDDPGAGKTIMAGLLFKELKLRNAVERVLILAPAFDATVAG